MLKITSIINTTINVVDKIKDKIFLSNNSFIKCPPTNAIIVTGIALVNTIFVYTRIGKLKYAFT